jgi:phosphate acetyltransferase
VKPARIILEKAAANPGRIVLPEGEEPRIIKAAAEAVSEGFAKPVLIGSGDSIYEKAAALGADIEKVEILNNLSSGRIGEYSERYIKILKESGKSETPEKAEILMKNPVYFGAMMVREKEADGMVAGAVNYSATVMRAAYRVIGLKEGVKLFSSFLIISRYSTNCGENGALVLADPSVNPEPAAEQLAEIALATAVSVKTLLGWEPRVALLSFSTKGSSGFKSIDRIRKAVGIARKKSPGLKIDGELQADAALVPAIARIKGAGNPVGGRANVLIFPNLDAGNISYKLIQHLSGADCYGPILQGFAAPVNDLSRGAYVSDIKGVIGITSVQSQNR